MKKIAIVTDTNAGILQTDTENLENVFVIPMPFAINGEEYFEDVNLTQEEFYRNLTDNADISTSQPSIGNVIELWENLLKSYEKVLHIPMSSSLSKTYETAQNFSKDFNGRVLVVDNKRISVTLKQSVLDAVNMVKDGFSAEEIKAYLEQNKLESSIYIMVDTLKYLKKGGRITPAAATIGTLLKIKPVLQIQGGKLDQFTKVVNEKIARIKMINAIKKDFSGRFKEYVDNSEICLGVAYTNCKEKANIFVDQIKKEIVNVPVKFVEPLPLSIACHIGDGALAIACFKIYKGKQNEK